MKTVVKVLAAISFLFSVHASAGAFDQADALFAQRENNLAKIADARAAYKAVLGKSVGSDAVYAVQQLGKLSYYEGELLTSLERNPARRTEIFADCRRVVEKIATERAAVSEYHFWKLLCTAFWVQSAPLLSRLGEIGSIKRYFDSVVGDDLEPRPELGMDARYMYAGMNRVLAGIYREDLSSMVRSGLPNSSKALELADRALATEAGPGQEVGGDMYYSNHRGRGEVLIQDGRADEAKAFLTQVVEDATALLEANQIPADIIPETKAEIARMRALASRI
jgi:hypothetical protein